MKMTQSMLDCPCSGNGFVFLNQGGQVRCPIHFECGGNEEYRLTLLRLEYQNLRKFALHIPEMNPDVVDLNLPTTPKGIDQHLEDNYLVENPESWVRALQHYVREHLISNFND